VPTLVCPNCGLSYGSTATLIPHLGSATGASCPRCGTALTEAGRDADTERRPRPASTRERHRAAVRRTLAWAEQAAADGDYNAALAWLRTIEAVDGRLPAGLDAKQRAWAAGARSEPAKF
jgi:hypothetical protein